METAPTTPAPAAAPVPLPAPQVKPHPHTRGGRFRRVLDFLWWLLTGMGLLTHFFSHGLARAKTDEVVVYSVPRSFFLWMVVLVGFVGAEVVKRHPAAALAWGWIYVVAVLYTFASLLFDAGILRFLLWGMILAFIWLIARYLEDFEHIAILSGILRYFHKLSPKLDPGFTLVMSWALLFPWIGSLFYTFTRGCKHFSPNGIEEWHFEGREVMDRSGLKFRSHFRDLFESVLGLGAGDLEAVDGNQQVVKRWENVLFLVFLWPRLDAVLHQRAATVENAPEEPVEVEDVNKK